MVQEARQEKDNEHNHRSEYVTAYDAGICPPLRSDGARAYARLDGDRDSSFRGAPFAAAYFQGGCPACAPPLRELQYVVQHCSPLPRLPGNCVLWQELPRKIPHFCAYSCTSRLTILTAWHLARRCLKTTLLSVTSQLIALLIEITSKTEVNNFEMLRGT